MEANVLLMILLFMRLITSVFSARTSIIKTKHDKTIWILLNNLYKVTKPIEVVDTSVRMYD